MHPFFARILDKPVCAILDGCQNMYNKLSVAVPSLFGSTQAKPSLRLKCDIKSAKPQPPKKPQRGIMRETVTFLIDQKKPLHRYHMDEIDYVYRYNRMPTLENRFAMELNGPYENIQRPATEPNWLFATDDLSDSLIGVRRVRPSNEPLPPKAQEEDTDVNEKVTEVDEPHNHYKHLIRLLGFYYPETEKEEADGFILVFSDDDDEDDDYA